MRVRFRGVPPPPKFDLYELPDNAELRQEDVAAWQRFSLAYTERRRREKLDGLEWKIVNNRPRTTVGSLKKALAASTVPGNTAPDFRETKYVPDAEARRPRRLRQAAAAPAAPATKAKAKRGARVAAGAVR
jgi:hypothetical protein